MEKLVYGVGRYEKGKYTTKTCGKITKEYRLWISMLRRCYSDALHEKSPTYLDTSVSTNFKDFQYFAEWCQTQIGFGLDGYQLDKDMVNKGNKEYSENNCVFIPSALNNFLIDRGRGRGNYPLGVSILITQRGGVDYTRIRAFIRDGTRKQVFLGNYSTLETAFAAYKKAKEAMAKQLATKWAGMVDDRVITALNNFEVHYND
jgi:hypothetical protein